MAHGILEREQHALLTRVRSSFFALEFAAIKVRNDGQRYQISKSNLHLVYFTR